MLPPRNVLSVRNPLAFPTQRPPRLDRSHIAFSSGAVPALVATYLPKGTALDVASGAVTANNAIYTNMDGLIGPSVWAQYPSQNVQTTFASRDVTQYTSYTFAAIIRPLYGNNGSYSIIAKIGGGGAGLQFGLYGASSTTYNLCVGWYGQSLINSGFALTVGQPYFVVVTQNGSAGLTFAAINLSTGAVQSGTGSAPTLGSAGTNNYIVNGDGGSNPSRSNVAAFAYLTGAGLNLPEIMRWLQDPWSLWYQPTAAERVMLNGGPPSPITSGIIPITTTWSGAAPALSRYGTINLATGWSATPASASSPSAAGSLPLTTGWSGGFAEIVAVGSTIPITTNWQNGDPPAIISMAQNLTLHDAWSAQIGKILNQGMTLHQSDYEQWTWGRTLSQNLTIHLTDAEKMKFSVTDAEIIKLASALYRTFPAVLSQNLTVHQAQVIATALTMLQRLKLIEALSPTNNYHLALIQALRMNSALANFWAKTLRQNINVHPTQGVQYRASPVLSQALTVHLTQVNTLVIALTGKINLHETDVLKAIYKGDSLLDGVVMTGLYVSPSGTVTTWAINTRTNAVTEYTNYNFTSFAQMGLKYIATAPDGIYELDGETDNGTNIVADMLSGFMALNGTKLGGLKGAYLALRGEGQYFLKLISGDGRQYVYQLQGQPGLMNAKVNIGKGLRTVYLAWELISTGPDFDLDRLEFIPMLSDRRV